MLPQESARLPLRFYEMSYIARLRQQQKSARSLRRLFVHLSSFR